MFAEWMQEHVDYTDYTDPCRQADSRRIILLRKTRFSATLVVTSATLVVTSATLLGTSALLVVTRSY